ncbi:MAG TPA: lysophospholipid acyltransferase family protein [Thermoanaerobaculia bacterium]|nr:lysophospholipid acyltransferase family protein [Thermoanaerobaculia bacterium]
MLAVLGSLLAWGIAIAATLFFGITSILTSVLPGRDRYYTFWARSWAQIILFFARIPVRLEVSESARAMPAAIFMSNHESALDILALFLAVPHDVKFVAKSSLFSIPILGWSMRRGGFVPVDRKDREKAREALGGIAERLRKGDSVLVFPEGTRSRDGTLGPFKKAGFLLALKTGLPIVPIGIAGARAILRRGDFRLHKGLVTVKVGEPIPTAGLGIGRRAELMKSVRTEILRLRG